MRAPTVIVMLSVLGSMIPLWWTAEIYAQSAPGDVQDLIYLAPERPVFIRLHIRVLGEGFRGLRAVYAKQLNRSLDADGDGVLNEAEMRNIPPSDQLLPPRGPQEKLLSFNNDPVDANTDGAVTLRELTDYVRKSSGPVFDFKLAPSLHAGQVDLFEVIDANSDGTLDSHEIQSAGHSILKFDADADEIIDQSELSIDGHRRLGGYSNSESAELLSTLVVVDPEADGGADALFDQLVNRYDRPQPSGDDWLDAGELGVSKDEFAKWDTNGDGVLKANEGRAFVLNPVPDLEISVPLGSNDRAAIVQSRNSADLPHPESFATAPGPRGNLQLTMGGERFDLLLGACPAPLTDLHREYARGFVTADVDGNEYLDMTEVRQLGILPAHFFAVDRNGDRMVPKEELLDYVELESLLFASRVFLLLSHEPQAVIDLIDQDADDELGLREVRDAPASLLSWDLNGDERITPDERPANSRLILQNGETMLFRWDQFRSRSHELENRGSSGPKWFRNMDRNQDGDVSPREFLGRSETFKRLDKNADGLISKSEVWSYE